MSDIVGVWHLESFYDIDDAGRVGEGPLGPDPEGLLIYTADGHVSVSMMRMSPGAPHFMGYAGHWRLSGDRVLHRIWVTPRWDWLGTEQPRRVELDGDRLTLYAMTMLDGREQVRVLSWRRASSPAAG